jgi:hypothetical protein
MFENTKNKLKKILGTFKIAGTINTTLSDKQMEDKLEPWVSSVVEAAKKDIQSSSDVGQFSDGYHTFDELYYYRMLYNAAFFNSLAFYDNWADGSWHVEYDVHKSKRHSDGEECFGGGWFIVMAELPTGQVSNHYEMKYWDLFHIPEKEKANVWDGHTPQDAAERLEKFLRQ